MTFQHIDTMMHLQWVFLLGDPQKCTHANTLTVMSQHNPERIAWGSSIPLSHLPINKIYDSLRTVFSWKIWKTYGKAKILVHFTKNVN